jgi:hypothetical protein
MPVAAKRRGEAAAPVNRAAAVRIPGRGEPSLRPPPAVGAEQERAPTRRTLRRASGVRSRSAAGSFDFEPARSPLTF